MALNPGANAGSTSNKVSLMTETFTSISPSLNVARSTPREVNKVRTSGPMLHEEKAPPGALMKEPGKIRHTEREDGQDRPCQYTTARASAPCADLSQVPCSICRKVEGPGCDCGLRFCLAHAARVEAAGKHGADQEGVTTARAEPPETRNDRALGVSPVDLPPRETARPNPAPPLTVKLPGPGPPPELIFCQYTDNQAWRQCPNLSTVACHLHRPNDGIVCECGSRFCGFHAKQIVTLGLHEGQHRAGAPPRRCSRPPKSQRTWVLGARNVEAKLRRPRWRTRL